MQFHVRPGVEIQPGELGYAWLPLAVTAAQAAMESRKVGGSGATETEQNPGMPGREPSAPRQPSAVTTVSPTIQAQISPQISPVMTQIQSSPGATVGADPYQYMPGGLAAEHAVSPYGNWAAPGIPSGMPGTPAGPGISPMQPFTMDPRTGNFVPTAAPLHAPVTVGEARMTDIPWLPIAIVGGGIALAMMLPRMRRRR